MRTISGFFTILNFPARLMPTRHRAGVCFTTDREGERIAKEAYFQAHYHLIRHLKSKLNSSNNEFTILQAGGANIHSPVTAGRPDEQLPFF